MACNQFSPRWYSLFLAGVPPERTDAEVAFVQRHLPPASHPLLLDLCCGSGRHARALAQRGYRLHGIDNNADAISRARAAAPSEATFQVLDMRRLEVLRRVFDGAVNLWQSFGYFDDETNMRILQQVRAKLRPGGRAVFDLYNRAHFAELPVEETATRDGVTFHTTRTWAGNRLRVALRYEPTGSDAFEWRLYTASEFSDLCRSIGLRFVHRCARFSDSIAPSVEHARMQFVVER